MEKELVFGRFRNYIGLHGTFVDAIASRDLEGSKLVSAQHIQNRVVRDGNESHITIISPPELKYLTEKRAETLSKKDFHREIITKVTDHYGNVDTWVKPIDLGIGSCREGDNVSYFKVIHWPLGQNIRIVGFGLKEIYNFHITVGFHPIDVHLYKGPGSLCDLQHLSCSKERLKSLIELVPFYYHDTIFMRALYKQCTHLKARKELLKLSKLYLLANLYSIYSESKTVLNPLLKVCGISALLGFAVAYCLRKS
ncbi:hypothetical protein K501DRAFT_285449, partial [Backusella circina FSU 941]